MLSNKEFNGRVQSIRDKKLRAWTQRTRSPTEKTEEVGIDQILTISQQISERSTLKTNETREAKREFDFSEDKDPEQDQEPSKSAVNN